MQAYTVEILVNVTQDEESRLYGGAPKFTGEYVLRALDIRGDVLREARITLVDLGVTTSDYARLRTLHIALDRLYDKLCGARAGYALRVVQSSKNVDGWLARGWKRNIAQVKEMTGDVDTLLTPFPRREFVRLSRAELEAAMSQSKGSHSA
ncbi:MAG: hypothetical protein IT318_12995 [Anaerolineales bacterium]|nr:hypothetical protein [Anaerolineales bacterium]